MSNIPGLTKLVLSSNLGIGGSLPASWSSLDSLQELLLDGCGLSGTLPDSWEAMTRCAVCCSIWRPKVYEEQLAADTPKRHTNSTPSHSI